ncbi:antibiotic biosynthesis monooxygenase [Falsiroseomonas oryziterrae]|uniref:antibiotic biosynthesis monooxygenase n=1 Tax=Falsiroseomonas oryziterrae TaxID=2911368 RepID=UPI001F1E81A4|nr:antibiotic biosynthesis monooxygenase [Roseomonas sp. NPKOSM-4]
MYAIIRRHPGEGRSVMALTEEARRLILPRLQRQPGFAGYLAFLDEAGLPVSVGLFSDRQTASVALEGGLAVAESGVDVTAGVIELAQSGHDHGGMATADTPLYVTIRFYAGAAPGEEVIPRLRGLTVPLMQRQPGFRGCFALRDERHPDHVAAVSLWDSRRAAMAAHELVRDVILQQMADIFPTAPDVVAGASYVASLDAARLCTA